MKEVEVDSESLKSQNNAVDSFRNFSSINNFKNKFLDFNFQKKGYFQAILLIHLCSHITPKEQLAKKSGFMGQQDYYIFGKLCPEVDDPILRTESLPYKLFEDEKRFLRPLYYQLILDIYLSVSLD